MLEVEKVVINIIVTIFKNIIWIISVQCMIILSNFEKKIENVFFQSHHQRVFFLHKSLKPFRTLYIHYFPTTSL